MIVHTFGHYTVEAQLGSGGMGAVYLAYDSTLQRRVAIKVLTGIAADANHAALLHEARAASALNHPNICTVYEVGEAEGRPFIAMEYVAGRRLAEAIGDRGLPVDTILRYGVQLSGALAHAHERGVVHRDLKSANIVVTEPGHVKVLDFGLARMVAPDGSGGGDRDAPTLSITGSQVSIVGTLAYMAPEVLCGQAADVRSDIWSLGVVLYEMATGRLPFDARGTFELSAAILREAPAPFTTPLPASLRGVIVRCLAKEPAQRYQHAAEVTAALEAIHSDVVTGPRAPVIRSGRRVRVAAWVAALAVVAAGAALIVRQATRATWVDAVVAGRLQRLVASDTEIQEPTVSPDGKLLAYVGETADGQLDLFVMRVSGGEPVRLTSDGQREAEPRFSPDGERIAFTRRDLATGFSEVCIMPTFGGDVATVTGRAGEPAWSPDGTRVAFIRRPRPGDPMALMATRIDGSDARVLLRGDGTYPFVGRATWSPDGRTIAVVRSTGGVAGEIWLVPLRGGGARRLSEDTSATFSHDPWFTPDGRGLVHSSNRGGAVNLWYLPIDGGAPTRMTAGPGPDESPSVAGDGRVVFVNSRWRNALVLHQLRGASSRVLLTHAPYVWAPVFSPDGREIAFSRAESDGSWHVWTVGVDGSRPRQVTATAAGEIYPRFTPDGQWLVFHSWAAPKVISRARRSGGESSAITTSPGAGDGFADVSPDGRTIVFARASGRAEMLFTVPAGGGPATRLTATPGSVPRWSPDGRQVAFSGDRTYAGGVYVVRADGTGERRLSAIGGWPVWWAGGRQIAFLVVDVAGNQEIRVIPEAGGDSEKVPGLRYSGTNMPFDVSPDGTAIVTSNAIHVSTEVWLLEPAR